jgi:predicted phosphodiesterase
VIVAGDVINFGPFTVQVVERVVESGWVVIKGNGESTLLDYGTPQAPEEWKDPNLFPIPPWLSRQLGDRWKTIIATWPDTLSLRYQDSSPIRVVHGTPRSAWESLYPNLADGDVARYLSGVQESTFIAGHTHLSMERKSGSWHLLNPGSVGAPLDGRFTASYMLLEGDETGWRPTFRRVLFDYDFLFDEFERIGFIEECGVIGRLIVEVFKTARPQFGFLRWRDRYYPKVPLSEEILEEYFERCEWWEFADDAYRINL